MEIFNLLKSLLFKRPSSEPTKPSNVLSIDEARAKAVLASAEAEKARLDALEAKEKARREKIKALQSMMPEKIKNLSDAVSRFGAISEGKWTDESKHMATLSIPASIGANWINSASNAPVKKIYCNKIIHDPLTASLKLIEERGLLKELKTFDGCFQIRMVRGSDSALSWHSYGIAIDINAKENPLNAKPMLSREFVQCWKDAGWVWGGDFSRLDGMHFQWAVS